MAPDRTSHRFPKNTYRVMELERFGNILVKMYDKYVHSMEYINISLKALCYLYCFFMIYFTLFSRMWFLVCVHIIRTNNTENLNIIFI